MGDWDWAWLPELVLNLILLKLPCLPDCVRFSSVCTSWRMTARSAGRGGKKQFPVPMLLFPTINRNGVELLVLYSLQEKRTYHIHFPFLRHHSARFCGFSLGWLATVDPDLSITLFKPSPKEIPHHHCIRIPPIMDAIDIPVGLGPRMPSKVILSADPTSSLPYVVIAVYGTFHKLAVWRSDHSNWIFPDRSRAQIYDALWLNDNLYVVNHYYEVLRVDGVWKGNHLSPKIVCQGPIVSISHHTNLMESSRGELLMTHSFLKPKPTSRGTLCRIIEVYKWDDKGLYTEVNDIGGDNLFMGDNCSMAVSASDCDSDVSNCVYYINDPNKDCKHIPTALPNDLCIFSLESMTSQTHHRPNHSLKILSPPIWGMRMRSSLGKSDDWGMPISSGDSGDSDDWPPIWITPALSDNWV